MKIVLKIASAVAVLAAFFAPSVHAGTFSACTVIAVIVQGDQNGYIQIACPAPMTALPACASAPAYVGFDKSTPAGKQYLALFTYAQAVGAKISGNIDATSCSPWQGNVALLTTLIVGY